MATARTRKGDAEEYGVRCRICGKLFPAMYLSAGRCDGCKWDAYIPAGYEDREKYHYDPALCQVNAMENPPLGVPFLDCHTPTIEEIFLQSKKGASRLRVTSTFD